ncbi:MAG: DNA polymerase III subunit alpha, partial [Planctomycetota bacterium]
EHVPLYSDGKSVTTQWTMEELERVGLLKMDFLGLKTLTVLDRAVKLIEETKGERIELAELPEGDRATYEMLGRGDSFGVFQLESGGMRDILKRMKPDRFEDLVAILALYRPGPLQTGMVDSFIRRKHGEEPVEFPHPSLEEVLDETYGTFVYQEQVMRIANVLAGFTLNEADNLRKAMGKKNADLMAKLKDRFVTGAEERDCSRKQAEHIWSQMEAFAAYCFNKSHTAAYAVLTYQTAYLKANHPIEFMAALLTCDMGATDKLVVAIDECRHAKIDLLPPSIEKSGVGFMPEDGAIRFGLAGIRGVGVRAVESLLVAREEMEGRISSLFDLCETTDLQAVNRQTFEALIKSGALDLLLGEEGTDRAAHRSRLMAALDRALRMGNAAQADRRAGQLSLFGGGGGAAPAQPEPDRELPRAPDWPENQVLAFEKETLGFYITSHPLTAHERALRSLSTHSSAQLRQAADGARVRIGGMVTGVQARYPRNGRNKDRKYARFRLEDFDGTLDCVCFSDAYEKLQEILVNDAIGFLEGSLATDREEPSLRVDKFVTLEEGWGGLISSVTLRAVGAAAEREAGFASLRSLLGSHPGTIPVMIELEPRPGVSALYRLEEVRVAPTEDFYAAATELLGPDAVTYGRAQVSAPPRRAWGG